MTDSPNSVFEDSQWVRVNPAHIKRLLDVFDKDTSVQTAFKIRMNSVLSGGIRFHRRFHSMSNWNSRLFSSFLVTMVKKEYRLKWACGLAPITFEKNQALGWVPRVLDWNPDKHDLMMRSFADGRQTLFRWYEITDPFDTVQRPEKILQKHPNRKLLPNIITLVESEPDSITGAIRSLVSILDRDYHLEEVLLMCAEDAYPRMARPGIVSEKPMEKLDPDNLRNPTDPTLSPEIQKLLMHLDKEARMTTTGPSSADAQPQVSPNAIVFNRMINSRAAFLSEDRQSRQVTERLERMARTREDMGPQLYLADGRVLKPHVQSQAPDKIMLDYMTQRKRTVCELFSTPYSLLAAEGGSKVGSNPAAMKVFNDAQNSLQQDILNDLHLVYTWIYSKTDRAEFFGHKANQLREAKQRNEARKKRKREEEQSDSDPNKKQRQEQEQEQGQDEEMEPEDWKMDEKEIQAFTEVEIRLPALPDFDVMRQLRLDGFLKYESFVSYCSMRFSIDERDFNTKPELDLKDLRGVKEVDEVVGT